MSRFIILFICSIIGLTSGIFLFGEVYKWEIINGDSLDALNDTPWTVYNDSRNVKIRKDIEENQKPETSKFKDSKQVQFFKLTEGWLVYENKGEFGAWVRWYDDQFEEYTHLSDKHVRNIQVIGSTIYVYGGLSHLSGSSGFIYELVNQNGKWELTNGRFFRKPILRIGEIPSVLGPGLIVLSENTIFRMFPTQLYPIYGLEGFRMDGRAVWSKYSVNSIAMDYMQNFYIGTEKGIIRVIKEHGSYEEHWVFPSNLIDNPSKSEN
tara:strand:- start:32 stop:826 length:795 start_codon:yes stop_codon:yes gene_type:complete